MKVGVIAAEMEGKSTGVGRYLSGLLGGLRKWDHGTEWHLFFQGDRRRLPAAEDESVTCHFAGDHGHRVLWEQLRISRQLTNIELDLLFGPAYALPWRLELPSVVAIHDLSFELLPGEFGLKERWRRRLLARRAGSRADRVLVDTSTIGSLLEQRYGLARGKIARIPLGIDLDHFSPLPAADDVERLAALGIHRPYVLWVGTVFERRLPDLVFDAFAALRRTWPDLTLVLAGDNRLRRKALLGELLDAAEIADATKIPGWVEEDCLGPLYRQAEMGIYLSRHEGFGIPPLECLACGTPVVVSPGLGLDDAWPDYAFRCPELTIDEVAATMDSVLARKELLRQVLEEAPGRLSKLSWRRTSESLVELFREVVA